MFTPSTQFRIRSFVGRNSRQTAGQRRAQNEFWTELGLEVSAGWIDASRVFNRNAPLYIEIGFGSGQSLLALAAQMPEYNFIGIETHKPGVGALLLGIKQKKLTNLRVYNADAIDVLTQCLPAQSVSGFQVFFPDPWQKRRHFERRLIQLNFIELITDKLKIGGELHLATDWEDYARHMLRVLSQAGKLTNLAGGAAFAGRSSLRPIVTKFEQRAEREGRSIWELQFKKL